MKKYKKMILQIVVCMGLLCAVWGSCFILLPKVERTADDNYLKGLIIENDYEVLADIEKVVIEKNEVSISGWAMKMNSVAKEVNLILKEINGKREIVLRTQVEKNHEVEEVIPESKSGEVFFLSKAKTGKIKKNTCYEILLCLSYETMEENSNGVFMPVEGEKKISLRRYWYNNEIYRYNPERFEAPKIQEESIQEVIKYGELLFWGEKECIWIYEYKGKIYWIAGEGFRFEETGKTYIPFLTYTTEIYRLPEYMQKDGCNNLDFRFENQEIMLNIPDYRIAVKEVPQDYVITWLKTGVFYVEKNDWEWSADIPMMKQVDNE